jgi:plasminogen activator
MLKYSKERKIFQNGLMAAFMLCSLSNGATAQHVARQADYNVGSNNVNVHASLGILNGESHEIVDWPEGSDFAGTKLSELIWTLDNVYMIGAGISVRPWSWLTLNFDGWNRINKDSATMDDYDWIGSPYLGTSDWDHWSHHPNTQLEKGYMLDISAEISAYTDPLFSLKGIVGFKRDYWKWNAYDGSFVYSISCDDDGTCIYDYRGYRGNFTGLGITYEQEFNTPYFGIAAKLNFDKLQLNARLIGSPWVDLETSDTHHQRNPPFVDRGDFERSNMIGLDLGAHYQMTENLSLGAMYHYQEYDETKGFTVRTDETGEIPERSSHESDMFSVFMNYRFGL